MNGLIAYSGISAKIHAMKGKLISDEEFLEISNLANVSEMVAYLSKHPGYRFLLTDIDFQYISRSALEEMIIYSPCMDIHKIYSFSTIDQKAFVKMYYVSYQIHFLKSAIRKLYNNIKIVTEASNMEKLFAGHADFDFSLISQSKNIDDLILNLKNSMFYEPLKKLKTISSPSLFDYETSLDLFYLKEVWKIKERFNKNDKEVLTHTYGKQIDMLNLMWIFRTKKYYSVPVVSLKEFLIPERYKITKHQMIKLINSEDIKEFLDVVRETYYGKYVSEGENTIFQYAYHKILTNMFAKDARSNPFSLAVITAYLYLKEKEVKKLITIAECIRYKYSPEKIIQTLKIIGGVE